MSVDRHGFTLIEVVVTVAITLFLTGFVVVNYNTYNDVQTLKQAALTLKNNLRLAQSTALAGDKPTPTPPIPTPPGVPPIVCTTLTGYTVSFLATQYSVQALCNPEGPVGNAVITSLPSGVAFSPVPAPITFQVLARGTTMSETTMITLSGFNKVYGIAVSPGGNVSDAGLQ